MKWRSLEISYLKLDPNCLFFIWALLIWRSIFVTVERGVCVCACVCVCVCVCEREREREREVASPPQRLACILHWWNFFLLESELFSFFTFVFLLKREIKCYVGGTWFIVLVMPGVQGLAAHLELNIGVGIIIGGISSIWVHFRCSRSFYCNFPRVYTK